MSLFKYRAYVVRICLYTENTPIKVDLQMEFRFVYLLNTGNESVCMLRTCRMHEQSNTSANLKLKSKVFYCMMFIRSPGRFVRPNHLK
jgi:hypothetical protein